MRRPLLALLLAGALLPAAAFLGRVDFSGQGDFSENAITRGVRATRAQCDAVPNGLWATAAAGDGECLKYWADGLQPGANRRVLVFLHGDIWVGAGKTSKRYLDASNESLQRDARAWGKRLGVPYVFVGRPGTHGSSGDHMQRRRPAESRQISAALDVLKVRYGIEEFVVAGQSGGGHATASLLTLRNDIVCAVPTSAPSSPKVRWMAHGWPRDSTGFADSYEPSEHLDKGRMHPQIRVFVLGNPADTNVVWPSQTILADRLQQAGVTVSLIEGEGTGPEAHGLSNSARLLASWCAKDLPTEDILQRATGKLKG